MSACQLLTSPHCIELPAFGELSDVGRDLRTL